MSRTQQRKRPRPAPSTSSAKKEPPYLWIGLGAVVVLALAAAFLFSSGDDTRLEMPLDARVEVTGEALPAFGGDPASDPGVGVVAPELSGEDFTGGPLEITADGRPKVLLFLAHWCPHCQREVPAVQAYQEEVGFPPGVDLYSVATSYSSSQPNWPPSDWLAREGWTFPVLVDDPEASAWTAFGQGGFPFYVFIDAAGDVAMRLSGEQDPSVLASLMEQLAGS